MLTRYRIARIPQPTDARMFPPTFPTPDATLIKLCKDHGIPIDGYLDKVEAGRAAGLAMDRADGIRVTVEIDPDYWAA